jgi:hypothetical protein
MLANMLCASRWLRGLDASTSRGCEDSPFSPERERPPFSGLFYDCYEVA